MSRGLVAVPLAVERAALGRLPGLDVRRTGAGARRARRAAALLRADVDRYSGLAVVGVCGALDPGLAPGDLVVASEVRGPDGVLACPSAPLVVAALRAAGLRARSGPVHTADHLVDGAERAVLAATGAVAVDTESALLAAAARDRPALVVRAVADTPGRPLRSPSTVGGGLAALRSLRAAGPVLAAWAAALSVPTTAREVVLAPVPVLRTEARRAIETAAAAVRVARTDLLVVLDPADSPRSRRLVDASRRAGTPALLVGDPTGLELAVLAGAARIGVAVAASAPAHLVDTLVDALAGLGPLRRTEHVIGTDEVPFSVTREVG